MQTVNPACTTNTLSAHPSSLNTSLCAVRGFGKAATPLTLLEFVAERGSWEVEMMFLAVKW